MSLSSYNSTKTFDFSTLCTNIHHSKLKDKLRELVQLCFIKRNGQRRCKYLMLGRDRSYFIKKKFSETDIINMLEFLIDNILAIVLSVLLRYTDSDYPLLVSSNSSYMMSRASNVLLWSVTSLLNPQSIWYACFILQANSNGFNSSKFRDLHGIGRYSVPDPFT